MTMVRRRVLDMLANLMSAFLSFSALSFSYLVLCVLYCARCAFSGNIRASSSILFLYVSRALPRELSMSTDVKLSETIY